MENKQQHEKLSRSIRKDIFDLIRKLNRTSSVDHYNDLYSDIISYSVLASFLEIDTDDIFKKIRNNNIPDNEHKYINKHYKSSKESLDFDMKIIENVQDIYLYPSYYNNGFTNLQTVMKDSDNLELSSNFFDQFKPYLSDKLYYMMKEGRIILKDIIDGMINGAMVCSNNKFSPYVMIAVESKIIDAATIVHEMSHVYHFEKIVRMPYRNYYNCTLNNVFEVYPYSIELIFLDYLESINFNNNDVLNLKRMIIKTFLEFYSALEENLLDFNKKNFYDEYSEYFNYYSYARGMLLAFEFHDMYLNDKEFASYNMEKFLIESGEYDFLSLINRCGLSREKIESGEAVKEYIKKIFDKKC